jgi:hypothetical protein
VISVGPGQTLSGQNFNVTVFKEFGDGDCDGHARLSDAIVTMNYVAGINPPSDCVQNADINCDGVTDMSDLDRYLRIYAGLDAPVIPNCPNPGPFPAS